jgi:CelD/BcsL family acetyltransferase involved in cellulose biosynthesis
MHVRVIDSDAEFASLGPTWERLQAGAAAASIFASFDWQHLWWKTYGRGAPQRQHVVKDRPEVIGLLALYISTERVMRCPVRLLRFVGTGGDTSPDDLGPVLAAGREGEVARALADAVLGLRGWDVLHLHDMEPASPFAAAMAGAARRASLPCVTGRSERISYVELPATWDTWLGSLHRDRRYRVKKTRKDLLAAHPEARFFVWTDPATLDAGVDRLIHLHHTRWRETGQRHRFSSPEYVAFHRAVMHACFARDRLRLYALELGGQIAAMYYMYRFRGALYLMQTGFDPAYARLKPGHVLLGWIIEQAIAERCRVLDFLKGEHRYKDELATGERETASLAAFRMRPGAWAFRARRHVLPAVKALVLRMLGRGPRAHAPPRAPAS